MGKPKVAGAFVIPSGLLVVEEAEVERLESVSSDVTREGRACRECMEADRLKR